MEKLTTPTNIKDDLPSYHSYTVEEVVDNFKVVFRNQQKHAVLILLLLLLFMSDSFVFRVFFVSNEKLVLEFKSSLIFETNVKSSISDVISGIFLFIILFTILSTCLPYIYFIIKKK